MPHLYHLQQSWGKVLFSEACVKNSVHIREQCMLGDTGNKQEVRNLLECILVDVNFQLMMLVVAFSFIYWYNFSF